MRRLSFLSGAVALLVLLGGVAIAGAAPKAGTTDTKARTLRFDVRFSPFHLVDVEQGLIHCTGSIRLPGGQLTFQGLTTTAPTKEIAITGGTGRYQGAGGEATLVENPDQTGTLTIRLRR